VFLESGRTLLAHHHESGRLTNHQALIVLCLNEFAADLKVGPGESATPLLGVVLAEFGRLVW